MSVIVIDYVISILIIIVIILTNGGMKWATISTMIINMIIIMIIVFFIIILIIILIIREVMGRAITATVTMQRTTVIDESLHQGFIMTMIVMMMMNDYKYQS